MVLPIEKAQDSISKLTFTCKIQSYVQPFDHFLIRVGFCYNYQNLKERDSLDCVFFSCRIRVMRESLP